MREGLEKMLAEGHDGALLRFGLGQACLKGEEAEAAVQHLTQATAQNPRHSAAWKLLGVALHRLERREAAEAAWTQGLVVAEQQGDHQSGKEMTVFLKRLRRPAPE